MVRVAIERVKQCLELNQEAPVRSQTPPPARWPSSHGGISIGNLVVRYAHHLPPVLGRISFTINCCKKSVSSVSVLQLPIWLSHKGWQDWIWQGIAKRIVLANAEVLYVECLGPFAVTDSGSI